MRFIRPMPALLSIICVVVIVVLSLLPPSQMLRTGVSGWMEHFAAYFGTGLLMAGAFRRSVITLVAVMLSLAFLAALLELLQFLSPGRASELIDFYAGAGGAVLGAALSYSIQRIWTNPNNASA